MNNRDDRIAELFPEKRTLLGPRLRREGGGWTATERTASRGPEPVAVPATEAR